MALDDLHGVTQPRSAEVGGRLDALAIVPCLSCSRSRAHTFLLLLYLHFFSPPPLPFSLSLCLILVIASALPQGDTANGRTGVACRQRSIGAAEWLGLASRLAGRLARPPPHTMYVAFFAMRLALHIAESSRELIARPFLASALSPDRRRRLLGRSRPASLDVSDVSQNHEHDAPRSDAPSAARPRPRSRVVSPSLTRRSTWKAAPSRPGLHGEASKGRPRGSCASARASRSTLLRIASMANRECVKRTWGAGGRRMVMQTLRLEHNCKKSWSTTIKSRSKQSLFLFPPCSRTHPQQRCHCCPKQRGRRGRGCSTGCVCSLQLPQVWRRSHCDAARHQAAGAQGAPRWSCARAFRQFLPLFFRPFCARFCRATLLCLAMAKAPAYFLLPLRFLQHRLSKAASPFFKSAGSKRLGSSACPGLRPRWQSCRMPLSATRIL